MIDKAAEFGICCARTDPSLIESRAEFVTKESGLSKGLNSKLGIALGFSFLISKTLMLIIRYMKLPEESEVWSLFFSSTIFLEIAEC